MSIILSISLFLLTAQLVDRVIKVFFKKKHFDFFQMLFSIIWVLCICLPFSFENIPLDPILTGVVVGGIYGLILGLTSLLLKKPKTKNIVLYFFYCPLFLSCIIYLILGDVSDLIMVFIIFFIIFGMLFITEKKYKTNTW